MTFRRIILFFPVSDLASRLSPNSATRSMVKSSNDPILESARLCLYVKISESSITPINQIINFSYKCVFDIYSEIIFMQEGKD